MTIQMEPLQQYFQRVHEVKIFESIKTQTKNELFRHLNRTSLVSKEFVKWPKRDLSLGGDYRGKSGMAELIRAQGYLPFTWENRKFRLENQMNRVR